MTGRLLQDCEGVEGLGSTVGRVPRGYLHLHYLLYRVASYLVV